MALVSFCWLLPAFVGPPFAAWLTAYDWRLVFAAMLPLVAVAFLVSLFKARPSPFYILDEVEAALDDTNLGRLLEIYEYLRENSHLLEITHQKRTMEVGDALYGVTMRGDGVSAVISQRLRESEAS